jgi:TolB protein
LPARIHLAPGQQSESLVLAPLDDLELEGDETVVITLLPGPSPYLVGTPDRAVGVIVDDEMPPVAVLFSDDLDTDTSANWITLFGANNGIFDAEVRWAFDYGALGIPPAPNSVPGSTRGLFVQVNKTNAAAGGSAAIYLYPAGRSFSGNYALRFDMLLNFGAVSPTEHALAGLNHSGLLTNRVTQSTDANNTTRGTNFQMRRASCTDRPVPPPPPDTTVMDAELSPNGRQLLVVKAVGQNFDIYSANPDGSSLKKLTDHPNVDYQPSWAPDGNKFAFVGVHDGHQEIYSMQADGSGVAQLTRGTAHNSEPSWSPDGKQIVFRSERDGRPHVYMMNADGSGQRALTRDSSVGASPAFSRDGKKIIFSSTRTTRNQVWTMNPDGTEQTRLTITPVMSSGGAVYSPDGRTILFWSTRDGNAEVYLMQADGSNVRNISRNAAADTPAGWSPDGAWIYFRSSRDRGPGDIYRMRPDGSEVTRITTTQSPASGAPR